MDLVPEGELFTKSLSSLWIKGLNSPIETGNIIAQFDEVVIRAAWRSGI